MNDDQHHHELSVSDLQDRVFGFIAWMPVFFGLYDQPDKIHQQGDPDEYQNKTHIILIEVVKEKDGAYTKI